MGRSYFTPRRAGQPMQIEANMNQEEMNMPTIKVTDLAYGRLRAPETSTRKAGGSAVLQPRRRISRAPRALNPMEQKECRKPIGCVHIDRRRTATRDGPIPNLQSKRSRPPAVGFTPTAGACLPRSRGYRSAL